MKLLSVALAKTFWEGHVTDLNPKGRYLMREIIPFMLDKYKFKKYPSIDAPTGGTEDIIFEDGEFVNKNGELINIKLTAYDYGLSAESRSSTDDVDDFLDSLLMQLHEGFLTPHYKNIFTIRQYYSQLYINTDKNLDIINPKLKEISNFLSNNVLGYGDNSYELGGLSFWSDQIKRLNAPAFSFERAVSVPFSENRYLSSCALQTDKHLEVLELLEDYLS